jgi:asparagine synthase (glutamine-hydrolysing)
LSNLVFLQHNKGYFWQQIENFSFKGNVLFTPIEPNQDSASDFLKNSNGNFAWIFEDENRVVAAVDIIRSIPLFYFRNNNAFCLSDDAYFLQEKFNDSFDSKSITTFLENGYTLENRTLSQNIFALQPCEILVYDKKQNQLTVEKYFEFTNSKKQEDYEQDFLKISEEIFSNTIQKLNNRTAIIPLSGGHDSRFILAALIKQDYKNIICFTYGKKGSYEAKLAEQVCKQLDVKWHFVEYTTDIFKEYFTEFAWQYELYASQLTAVAHEQDFFAIQQLKNNGLLPEDGVLIPGFCADLPAGSKIPTDSEWADIEISSQGLIRFIQKKYFDGAIFSPKIVIEEGIDSKEKWVQAHESWFTKNKVSKFVNNAIRCYEFFGHEWLLPFWDIRFVEFWQTAPLCMRAERRFYKNFLHKHYFQSLQIAFENETTDEKLKGNKWFEKIKNKIPKQAKKVLKKIILKPSEQDVNNLKYFADLLCKDAQLNSTDYKDENQAHAAWSIKKLGIKSPK